MDKQILKQILRDNQQEVERYVVEPRDIKLDDFPCRVLVGVRFSPTMKKILSPTSLAPSKSFRYGNGCYNHRIKDSNKL